jgi:hypothetical protein
MQKISLFNLRFLKLNFIFKDFSDIDCKNAHIIKVCFLYLIIVLYRLTVTFLD